MERAQQVAKASYEINTLGVSISQTTIRDGVRCDSYTAFVLPVKHKKTLSVVTGTLVTKVKFEVDKENNSIKATGIEYQKEGKGPVLTVRANYEVILSAGLLALEVTLTSQRINQHLSPVNVKWSWTN
jgi:choline dehydrogenase-like flavoprotein